MNIKGLILNIGAVITLMAVAMFGGCRRQAVVWTGTYNFPSTVWDQDNIIAFSPDSSDVAAGSSSMAVISIRYAADASVESFPLIMETESPSEGLYRSERIRMNLLPIEKRTGAQGRLGIFETCDTVRLCCKVLPGWQIAFHPEDSKNLTGLYSFTFELIE